MYPTVSRPARILAASVTGGLTIVTSTFPGNRVQVAVQYTGTDKWTTPTPTPLPDGCTAAEYHRRIVATVRAGGEAVAPTADRPAQ
ncbi:hypothetical protein AB0O91_38225 [Kitasatospora sp. NPDC089797]|uniref:hypothetical protein n=1 Tax=Kitasatospora sp. NPDC089797 TaxID=3155298 RepID=UPI0034380054